MSIVNVLKGPNSFQSIQNIAIKCPFCKAFITPQYLFYHEGNLFAYCTNSSCNKHFILQQGYSGNFSMIHQNSEPGVLTFSEIIRGISPEFEVIYNQAYHAEQLNLNHICGMGYRKSLEFLIKDFLMSEVESKESKEKIKNKFLGACINDDVKNEKIKTVAERATWLGNDETHYVRKWVDKDVQTLKSLINLTIHWIESEIETRQLLADMPTKK